MIAPNMPPSAKKSKCAKCGYKHLAISAPSDALPNFASAPKVCPKCGGEMKEISLNALDLAKVLGMWAARGFNRPPF